MINQLLGQILYRSLKSKWTPFERGSHDPQALQMAKLQALLQMNQQTAFGKAHEFASIKTYAEFKTHVPIQNYDDHYPWIERVMGGEKDVLSVSPMRLFETTSGSTSANKLIPYTEDFLKEMSAASNAWIYDLYTQYPKLRSLKSYWSISPLLRTKVVTKGGIPVGMEDDMEYLGKLESLIYARFLAVPQSVSKITDHTLWKKTTCSHLVAEMDLGLISVWSPTFLVLLMEEIQANLPVYLAKLTPHHKKTVEAALSARQKLGQALWPQLQVISCWSDGPAASQVPALELWFDRTQIQPKGLLSTEAAISIPVGKGADPVVAINGHFIEFLDLETQETVMASDLVKGRKYSPVVTTSSGLYRYHLKDVVECTGHYHQTPRIKFLGKLESVSDLFGEKLSEIQAREAIELLHARPRFAMLVVGANKTSYDLLIETENNSAIKTEDLDRLLRRNIHFDYCRKLGQLTMGQVHYVKDGTQRYSEHLLKMGMRLGDIKPTHLGHKHDWSAVFLEKK